MKISQAGINLIKKYEGCRLQSYLCPANVWTIGYGHTGKDVYPGKVITQAEADRLLLADLSGFEAAVNNDVVLPLSQSQFDALVSFTYNCGAGNLRTLIKNRNLTQVADALLLYNKGGGKVLPGLVKRRVEERALFLADTTAVPPNNPYKEPTVSLRLNSKGESVRWVQWHLTRHGSNVRIDGIFGTLTGDAIEVFQTKKGLEPDRVVGKLTRAALKE